MPLFGKMPEIGKPAPGFSLHDQNGNVHSLADYKDKKLVVYFFPKANTPGWTKQACGFRDESEKYEALGIEILGISYDPKKALIDFKEKYRIPYNFLSDKNRVVGKKYGVNNYLFTSRKTFLIDEKGILVHIIEEVNLNTHPLDVLKAFENAITGD